MAVHKKYPALGRGLDVLMRTDEVHTGGSSSINEVSIMAIKIAKEATDLSEVMGDCAKFGSRLHI